MILIYGKGKVGQGVAALCDHLKLAYEIRDDADGATDFSKYSEIIPSPGVPQTHAVYATGKVTSELDFGYRFLPKRGFRIAAVTGTDGKSTTTWALYNVLRGEFGNKAHITGNWDDSFCTTVLQILKSKARSGWLAVEVSSFMAYALKEFAPDWSIFTNFESDHLNWHPSLAEYFRAKWRLMERTKGRCVVTPAVLEKAKAYGVNMKKVPLRIFGRRDGSDGRGIAAAGPEERRKGRRAERMDEPSRPPAAGVTLLRDRVENGKLFVSGRAKYDLAGMALKGDHNALNLLAVAVVANEAKICSKRTKKYLEKVGGLPHRIETIGTAAGVRFVDDSKATTPQALRAALSAFTKPVVLIAGGSDKGADFSELAPDFTAKVAKAFLIGATRKAVAKGLDLAKRPYEICDEEKGGASAMRWAVEKAFSAAKELGTDAVLLSPGCASFGLFKDYADRAQKFRTEAEKISSSLTKKAKRD